MRRIKLRHYVNKLFVERQKNGVDSFAEENLKQAIVTNIFWEELYHFSDRFMSKAIKAK